MTSFFGVGGNPFASVVGQKIEQATDGSLASENWTLNMEICDLINETEDGPKDAIKAIRKRLQQAAGKNCTIVMFSLTVLETCVKNCGRRFHVLVCNKEFISELIKIIGPKNDPSTAVQEKVLSLIQAWADAFHAQPDLSGVVQAYQELKAKGIEFPMTDLDAMAPIHTPRKSVRDAVDSAITGGGPPISASGGGGAGGLVSDAGPVTLSSDQLTKLRSDLDILQTNMTVFGEMINEMSPGNEHPSDLQLFQEKYNCRVLDVEPVISGSLAQCIGNATKEVLMGSHDIIIANCEHTEIEMQRSQELHATLLEMQERLVELISRLANDEVTAALLRINDHLNNLFLRYSRYEKNREASKEGHVRENGQDSLIDLTDEAAGPVPPLTSQMASLGIGGQLANLNSVPAISATPTRINEKDDTDFDAFAQSRNVDTKDSGSSYESNRKPDQISGNLAAAAEARAAQRTTPSMHKESDFDEMEAWLEGGGDKSVTSSEFERFLEERALAADRVSGSSNQVSGSRDAADFDRFLSERAAVGERLPNSPARPPKGKEPQDSSLFAL